MKHYVTALASMFIIANAASAQHVNLGVKGGLNVYTINQDNGPDYESVASFHGGLLAHIHMTKQFAVQPEVVYSRQGAKSTTANIETQTKLDYINVPVMVQYMFNNGFRLQAGPQAGFLVNARSETGNVETDIKNNLNTVDFTIGAGVGYVHPPSGIGIDARYNFGISNINENSMANDMHNRGFQVGIFYLFRHK